MVKKKDDLKWVRSRLAVFTFEEAWPYGRLVSFEKSEVDNLRHILTLCSVQKHKDAAGLGAMAYAFSEGDNTVFRNDDNDWYIRVVAKALRDKDKFRAWAQSESKKLGPEQARIVSNAINGSKKVGWPWDKAFTYAAALLAIKGHNPILHEAPILKVEEFPFWIAIDKHTKEGKEAIHEASKKINIPFNTALWLSFYFESAICQSLAPSLWWDRERQWKLSKLNLSDGYASEIWSQLRGLIKESLTIQADKLASRILDSNIAVSPPPPAQLELF